MTMPRNGSVLLPSIDGAGPEHAIYATARAHLALTPSLLHFFRTAEESERRPLLLTHPGARLSTFTWMELHRQGGRWITLDPDGTGAREALYWRDIETIADVLDVDTFASRPPSSREMPPPDGRTAAILLDVTAVHAPRGGLVVGGLAEELTEMLDCSVPDLMGVTEPLGGAWDRERLTHSAREGMPRSAILRAATSTGIRLAVMIAHTPLGLVESVRVTAPAGIPGVEAMEHAADVIAEIQKEYPLLHGTAHVADLDAGTTMEARPRFAPIPAALALGVTALDRWGLSVTDLDEKYGAISAGRRFLPEALVRFGPSPEEALEQEQRLLAGTGAPNLEAFVDEPLVVAHG